MEHNQAHGDINVDINHNHDNNCDGVNIKGGLNDNNGNSVNFGGHHDNCGGNHTGAQVSLNHDFGNGNSISVDHSHSSSGNDTHIGFTWRY